MIHTDKGEFSSFAVLRMAYLEEMGGNPPIQGYFNTDEWDDTTLHISELGKCPRKQIMRLAGKPKRPKKLSAKANDTLMFWQGNIIHALTVGACYWAGIAVSHEETLPGLPTGWSGHFDLIWWDRMQETNICWDGKTVRQNAFDYWYSWPKPEEAAQMRGYLRFLPECAYGEIEHIDRGGANTPVVSIIGAHNSWVDERMDELDQHRQNWESAEELPDVLPHEFSLTYLKVRNEPIHLANTIYHGPNWQCGWCDYLHGIEDKKTKEWTIFPESPCKPDMTPKFQVAKMSGGSLKYDRPDLQPEVKAWLEDQLLEWRDPEPDVE